MAVVHKEDVWGCIRKGGEADGVYYLGAARWASKGVGGPPEAQQLQKKAVRRKTDTPQMEKQRALKQELAE